MIMRDTSVFLTDSMYLIAQEHDRRMRLHHRAYDYVRAGKSFENWEGLSSRISCPPTEVQSTWEAAKGAFEAGYPKMDAFPLSGAIIAHDSLGVGVEVVSSNALICLPPPRPSVLIEAQEIDLGELGLTEETLSRQSQEHLEVPEGFVLPSHEESEKVEEEFIEAGEIDWNLG